MRYVHLVAIGNAARAARRTASGVEALLAHCPTPSSPRRAEHALEELAGIAAAGADSCIRMYEADWRILPPARRSARILGRAPTASPAAPPR